MKAKVTLDSTTFHCEGCGIDFKSTDSDRKECVICESKSITVVGDSSITTITEVDDDFHNNYV